MKLLLGRLHLLGALVLAFAFLGAGSAQALPSLQLGPSGSGWTYDAATQTWVNEGPSFELAAYANATKADGGNGDYAWSTPGTPQYAYLVVSAIPKPDAAIGDAFSITIDNDGGALTMVGSGFGTPPPNDPNDLSPHGIFPTWYEVYEFQFDSGLSVIGDTQSGETGTGMGYTELFDVDLDVNSLADGVSGVHFDLFTIAGGGQWNPNLPADQQLVEAFAPFSHDAETGLVPEPQAALLFGVGGLISGMVLRRRR